MNIGFLLLISMGTLLVILIALIIILVLMEPPQPRKRLAVTVNSIKKEIEHEAEEESREELMPFNKPPRLTRPSARKRI